MSFVRFLRRVSLLALLVVGALVVGGITGAGAPLAATPAGGLSLLSSGTCTGQAAPYESIGYGQGVQVSSEINISCAPSGSKVTLVSVTVNLRHECSKDLNIRLDKLPKVEFLQWKDCSTLGGSQILTFDEPVRFDNVDPNGAWKLTVTDWCDNDCGGALSTWSIWVEYVAPTPVPTTPVPPTPDTPVPPTSEPTPEPTKAPTPGCEYLVASFGYEIICPVYATVQFRDASTSGHGDPIESWHWEFGDGRTSGLREPLSIILPEGYHQVRLTVRTRGGCQRAITRTIRIVLAQFSVQAERVSPPSGPVHVGDEVSYRILAINEGPPTCAAGVWFRFNDDEFSFVSTV